MRILGIDIGVHSIKAVELDSAFGRYEVRDYHELRIDPAAEVPLVLRALVQGLPSPPDQIAVALPASAHTFRNLTIPTRGKKAIAAAIAFELEDELPFPSEETVYDYSITSQSKTTSFVHVAATLKKHLASLLEKLKQAGIDPDLVTTETWAYRTLMNRSAPFQPEKKPVLLIQMGQTRTTLYAHWHGLPVFCRDLTWGSRNLTDAIAKKYNIPLDQAETAKLENGFVIPNASRDSATPDQITFSDTLAEPLDHLISELQQAMLTAKSTTHEGLETIYLSGAGSLLPGMAAFLQESLDLPVQPLQGLSMVGTSHVSYSEATEASFSLALASALCLIGPEKNTAINLRKGAFASRGKGHELDLANIKRFTSATFAVFGAMVLSYSFQTATYKKNLTEVDKRLENSIRTFFGQISNLKTYTSSPATLKSAVTKELTKQRELAKLLGPNNRSPLDFLSDLSRTVPKDVIVDVTQYSMGSAPTSSFSSSAEQSASISLFISNPQVADRLSTLLASKISGLQKTKIEEVPPGENNVKRWKVTFVGKPLLKSPDGK